DHEFRIGGNGQAYAFRVRELNATPHDAAGDIKLGILDPEHLRGKHEQHRVDPIGGDHLAWLAARPPAVAVDPTVLAWRGVKTNAARPVEHLSVTADIDTAGLRTCRQRDIAGADIAA